jgi:hypothetical protein
VARVTLPTTAWTTTDAAALAISPDTHVTAAPGPASDRIDAGVGATGEQVEADLGSPVDLTSYGEIRFWLRSDRAADGSPGQPYFLEFSYVDEGDGVGEEHRWLVPVNRAATWEQRRIGVEQERRGAVRRLRFRALDEPFTCHIDELIGVREELLADVERALEDELSGPLPDAPSAQLAQDASIGDTQLVVALNERFATGNRVRLGGVGGAPDELHDLAGVTHDAGANETTLAFVSGDTVQAEHLAPAARVVLTVPVLFAGSAGETPSVQPAIEAALVAAIEDPGRSPAGVQRDSYRRSGGRVVFSVRPAARAYAVDYRLVPVADHPADGRAVNERLLARLHLDTPLRINGVPTPVVQLQPPVVEHEPGDPAPFVVRVWTRAETAPRSDMQPILAAQADAAPIDAPDDREGVVVEL